jgi:hypothetical protein
VVVVPDPVPVEPPPQAARSTSALSTSMHNDASLKCFRAGVILIVIGLSISILFLLSQRLFVDLYRASGFSRMVSRYPRSIRSFSNNIYDKRLHAPAVNANYLFYAAIITSAEGR